MAVMKSGLVNRWLELTVQADLGLSATVPSAFEVTTLWRYTNLFIIIIIIISATSHPGVFALACYSSSLWLTHGVLSAA